MAEDKDRKRALDLAVSQIEKQFGKGSIMKLGEGAVVRDIPTISTGSLDVWSRSTGLSPLEKQRWPCTLLLTRKKRGALVPILMPSMPWTWAMPRNLE